MDKEQALDARIESKTKALINLNDQLNKRQTEFEEKIAQMDGLLEQKQSAFIDKIAELENRLSKPEKSITLVRDEMVAKEQELGNWQQEIDALSIQIAESENKLFEKAELIQEQELALNDKWAKFIAATHSILSTELATLKVRRDVLDTKDRLLKGKQNSVNDQVRSLMAAQKEILTKTNG